MCINRNDKHNNAFLHSLRDNKNKLSYKSFQYYIWKQNRELVGKPLLYNVDILVQ